MKLFKRFILLLFFCLAVQNVSAQMLDDEEFSTSPELPVDETDKDEELFNELFSDFPEKDRDVTKANSFNDALDQAADAIKHTYSLNPIENAKKELPPIDGDISIGITAGSFGFVKNLAGSNLCTFSVTLKSTLNREIKALALKLVYPHGTFAFVFADVPPNGEQEHFIRTRGPICYNLVGVPDININKCDIRLASNKECAKRLKWDEKMTAPIDVSTPSF